MIDKRIETTHLSDMRSMALKSKKQKYSYWKRNNRRTQLQIWNNLVFLES